MATLIDCPSCLRVDRFSPLSLCAAPHDVLLLLPTDCHFVYLFISPSLLRFPAVFSQAKLPMPGFLSREAKDLLKKLFKRIPAHRLGSGLHGTEDIKAQSFFARINFEDLLSLRANPPFVPAIADGDRPEKYFDKVRCDV